MTDPKIIPFRNPRQLDIEAADWFVRLEGGALGDEEQAEFEQWYRSNPGAPAAIAALEALWDNELELLKNIRQPSVAQNDVVEAATDHSTYQPGLDARFRAAMAACLMLACGLGILLYQQPDADPISAQTYLTDASEQRTIRLADGSTVLLNTDSRISVIFEDTSRRIFLDAGEAHFEVASDKARPFIVRTPAGQVTALGTAFTISVGASGDDVVVTEGRVQVSGRHGDANSDQGSSPVELIAGQSAKLSKASRSQLVVDALSDEVMSQKLDWHDGVLSFRGAALSQVTRSIERHSGVTIEIADANLAQQPIFATYTIGEIEPMLEALEITTGAQAEWLSDTRVRLQRAPE